MSDAQAVVPCQPCSGSGHTTVIVQTEDAGPQPIAITCDSCSGSGRA